MSFGKMPIANSFLNKTDIKNQFFYEMLVAFCQNCFTFQLMNVPKPKQMFNENYAYLASTSKIMKNHWKNLSTQIKKNYNLNKNSFVVEIGSNDGIFLENISNSNIPHLGVDASRNVSEIAKSKGINSLNTFFDVKSANEIRSSYGKADVIISTNTMHHIENINSVVEGMGELLKSDGTIITEDPSLKEMLIKNSYDQIYAEHMYIWSLSSMNSLFGKYGMEIYNIENNEFHGGCSRYYIAKKNKKKISKEVFKHMKIENKLAINKISTYKKFKKKTVDSKNKLVNFLHKLKKKNKVIVGYGAPAKSTTVLNYCGIDSSIIDKIFDNSETKISKYTPGKSLIYIDNSDNFNLYKSDYCVLFAWNHQKEILKKEKKYNGKWIVPVPELRVI
tara:strand:- start:2404 stop:3573 length:1170 start_codon:yes stop_codon:yes gene_type:complete